VFVVPAVPYLSALGFSRDELVQALGLSFTISTIALAIGLGVNAAFSRELLIASIAALAPALIGMWLGLKSRDRMNAVVFRKWFFVAMFLVGFYIMARSVIR
jgi:uncharacterized protein